MTDHPLDVAPAEAGYVTARLAEDYDRCVQELLGMTLWLPVKGADEQFIATRRGDRRLIRAYTSPARLSAVAGPDVDPAAAVRRPFSELIRRWSSDEIGLVVNPDSETELQLPPHLFPRILQLRQRMMAEQTGAAPAPAEPVVPVEPPSRIGEFRFAALVDGVAGDGRPVVSPERPRISDPEEKRRIRQYLTGGAVLQSVAGLVGDMFAPEKGEVVPAHTRTDGTWIWSDGAVYYLDSYDIGPEPEFHQHIVAHRYRCPEVPEGRLRLAGTALREHQRITADLHREWLRERG